MTVVREELRALQGRLKYIEQRESEREHELNAQLQFIQNSLNETQEQFHTSLNSSQQYMKEISLKWEKMNKEVKDTQTQAEVMWRELMIQEKEQFIQAQSTNMKNKLIRIERVVESISEQLSQLTEIVSEKVNDNNNNKNSIKNNNIAKEYKEWVKQHRKEEEEFKNIFTETIKQLQEALIQERQDREASVRRMEEMLTRNVSTVKVHHF